MSIGAIVERIVRARAATAARRSLLVAVSGIDGSGKGYVTSRLAEAIERRGLNVANLNVDGWLNLPSIRFNAQQPAETFYECAIRFEEMFAKLVNPLRDARSIRLEADFAEETATSFRRHVYEYQDIDVILVEGIFLLKRELVRHYDLSFWLRCSFETALERAIARAQEGLDPAETTNAYRTIYFPAQEIHFERDEPENAASMRIPNDDRLEPA